MIDRKDVAKLYVAMFNRMPEGQGLDYWYNTANQQNWDLSTLAENMIYALVVGAANDPELAQNYPQYIGLDVRNPSQDQAKQVIETVYKILFNKDYNTDPEGIDYWVSNIMNGVKTLGSSIADIIYAAEQLANDPTSPAYKPAKAFLNKIDVALYGADKVPTGDIDGDGKIDFDQLHDIVIMVTDDINTVYSTEATIDTWSGSNPNDTDQTNPTPDQCEDPSSKDCDLI